MMMYLTYFSCRKLSYKKIFPPSCFDVDGMVLKPQLRTALQVLGFQMYEEEFDKVWDRYYYMTTQYVRLLNLCIAFLYIA